VEDALGGGEGRLEDVVALAELADRTDEDLQPEPDKS
jgi:hypothetical protein